MIDLLVELMGNLKSHEKREKITEIHRDTQVGVFDHFGKCTHSNQMNMKKI